MGGEKRLRTARFHVNLQHFFLISFFFFFSYLPVPFVSTLPAPVEIPAVERSFFFFFL